MTTRSLLASLAPRFSAHPENIATEALLYLLREHASSAAAFADLLQHAGLPRPPQLTFRSQAYDTDGSIPDLLGTDNAQATRLIVEAKFWAHLTENQPNTYLDRLTGGPPSTLLFVCPAARQATLWALLMHKAREALTGPELLPAPRERIGNVCHAEISPDAHLASVSWRSLLETFAMDAAANADRTYQGDVEQLRGLCERMDSEAFLPLRNVELSPSTGLRSTQFADLVDETAESLRRDSRVRLTSTGGSRGEHGRFFSYSSFLGMNILYTPALWAKHGISPLWLCAKDARVSGWGPLHGAADLLKHFYADFPARIVERDGGWICAALLLPCGVEHADVISATRDQVLAMCNELAKLVPEELPSKQIGPE
jgi:hypothetical protein